MTHMRQLLLRSHESLRLLQSTISRVIRTTLWPEPTHPSAITPKPNEDSYMTMKGSELTFRQTAANHLEAVASLIGQMDRNAIERIVQLLRSTRDRGATLYVAGNGGSAATASHWVNDMGKATKKSGCIPVRAMCLSDNIAWLTALGNDEGYERIFAGQLENFVIAGDLLVVISASGNSLNLVKAVELARNRGATTIGFLGFDGGVLKDMVDDFIWVCTEEGAYEIVEDCHMALCHTLSKCLAQDSIQQQ